MEELEEKFTQLYLVKVVSSGSWSRANRCWVDKRMRLKIHKSLEFPFFKIVFNRVYVTMNVVNDWESIASSPIRTVRWQVLNKVLSITS